MSPRAAAGFQLARAPIPGSLAATEKNGSLIIAGKHEALEENEKAKSVYSDRPAKEALKVVDPPTHTESPYDVSA